MLFASKIVKIEILNKSGAVLITAEKGFTLPKNIESSEDSILILKGKNLRELERGQQVSVVTTSKAGDRVMNAGVVEMSFDSQLNIKFIKGGAQALQERRRYFKIKVKEKGRALFVLRDEETIRFDEPYPIEVQDINIGGIFMKMDYECEREDMVCVEIDLFVDYKLNAMVHILRVQRDEDGNITGYGCEFQALTAAQEDYIGKYINKVQLEQRQKARAMDDSD